MATGTAAGASAGIAAALALVGRATAPMMFMLLGAEAPRTRESR